MKIIESLKFSSFLHRPNQGSTIRWVFPPRLRTSICVVVLGTAGVILVRKVRKYIIFSEYDQDLSSAGSWVVPGLQNLGNNCFLNVILQALASCSYFKKYVREILEEYGPLSDDEDDSLPLVCSLASIVEGLNMVRRRSTVLNPRRLMLAMDHYIPNFNLTKQQDAEEAFSHLLSSLREEISQHYVHNQTCLADLPSLNNGRIIVTKSASDLQSEWQRWRNSYLKPFDGILGSTLICQSCSFKISLDFQLFHSLHLSIPTTNGVSTIMDGCTLDHCLKKFFVAEYVENYHCSNCWHNAAIKYASVFAEDKRDIEKLLLCNNYDPCDCKSLPSLEAFRWSNRFSHTLKQLSLAQTPKILCIHLQRASYDILGQPVKILDHVSFPLILDLSPLVNCGVGLNNIKFNSRISPQIQNGKVDAISNILQPIKRHIHYRLVSVIVHYGTSVGGHYAVYRKVIAKVGDDDPTSLLESAVEQWFCISDSKVRSVSEREVLDANATMLFYEKIE